MPACFFLNQQCSYEEPHIEQRNAFCKILQRVPQRQSEILFLVCRAELSRDWFRDFTGNHPQTSRKRVSRSDRPIKQIQSLREILLETPQTPTPLDGDIGERDCSGRESNK